MKTFIVLLCLTCSNAAFLKGSQQPEGVVCTATQQFCASLNECIGLNDECPAPAPTNAGECPPCPDGSMGYFTLDGCKCREPLPIPEGAATLAGASCSTPPPGFPKYCCVGQVPSPDFEDSCECNPGWSHKHCMCMSYHVKQPCHHCMAHLPETNRWLKSFTKTELYDQCHSCATKCIEEFEAGECADAFSTYVQKEFPAATGETTVPDILCTGEYLKKQLDDPAYPMDVKRSIYRVPKFTADDNYHQPSDWKVFGINTRADVPSR